MELPLSFSFLWPPIVIRTGVREEVILSTAGRFTAYDLASGKQLWMSQGLGAYLHVSPVWGEGLALGS